MSEPARLHVSQPSGLTDYDAARWLRPPPPVRTLYAGDGLGILTQSGVTTDVNSWQETYVPPPAKHCLLLLVNGSAHEYFAGGRPMTAGPAMAYAVCIANLPMRWVSRPTDNQVVHLHLPPDQLTRLLEGREASPEPCFGLPSGPMFSHLCRAFMTRARQGPMTALEAESYAVLLAPLLAGLPARSAVHSGGLTPRRLKQVESRLRSELDRDVTLHDLAEDARLSPFHFARAFKASTGLPPHRYQIMLRLNRVKDLLATTDLPITEIAARVGYDDPGYLARLFRQEVGMTPKAYRRERMV